MTERSVEIGVVIVRRQLKGPWAAEAWLPVAALPAAASVECGAKLSHTDAEQTFYAGAHTLVLHAGETAHYRDNLNSGRPSIWIALRPGDGWFVAAVSADPYAGEAMADGAGDVVEAVPMPGEIQRQVAEFIAQFHVERPFIKRKRDKAGQRPDP
jgi:hypothetical protein